jgi:hypothetical protein
VVDFHGQLNLKGFIPKEGLSAAPNTLQATPMITLHFCKHTLFQFAHDSFKIFPCYDLSIHEWIYETRAILRFKNTNSFCPMDVDLDNHHMWSDQSLLMPKAHREITCNENLPQNGWLIKYMDECYWYRYSLACGSHKYWPVGNSPSHCSACNHVLRLHKQ